MGRSVRRSKRRSRPSRRSVKRSKRRSRPSKIVQGKASQPPSWGEPLVVFNMTKQHPKQKSCKVGLAMSVHICNRAPFIGDYKDTDGRPELQGFWWATTQQNVNKLQKIDFMGSEMSLMPSFSDAWQQANKADQAKAWERIPLQIGCGCTVGTGNNARLESVRLNLAADMLQYNERTKGHCDAEYLDWSTELQIKFMAAVMPQAKALPRLTQFWCKQRAKKQRKQDAQKEKERDEKEKRRRENEERKEKAAALAAKNK